MALLSNAVTAREMRDEIVVYLEAKAAAEKAFSVTTKSAKWSKSCSVAALALQSAANEIAKMKIDETP